MSNLKNYLFTSGENRKIIEINKNDFSLKILPLICYEIIYSGKIFNNSNFDLIINHFQMVIWEILLK